ncbi:hypothetical protein C0993_001415 [Termitomyces sp. T159_Od127]|nr:hypothetical protein C0993_001415 [Termitomyces sp. T159_Od127]
MSQEAASLESALTSAISMENEKVASRGKEDPLPGHGESALPEDKVEEALENEADDWENDPENARNWPWRTAGPRAIVRNVRQNMGFAHR